MKNIFRVWGGLFLVCIAASTMGVLRAQDDREQEVSRQVFPLAADGVFTLKNVNGSVSVKAWDQPTVEIVSTKRGPSKEKMDMVKIEITADANRIDVDTVYPRWEHNLNVAVSYEIMMPRTTRVRDIHTVNGSLDIDGMAFEVNASTVNGSVKVMNSSGRVNAETVNGSVTAELDQIDPQADMKFETVNGSIKLYLTEKAGADISAETVNGGLHSDFPLTVRGKFGPKRLNGTLGQGGARIRMETVNGGISLFRR